MSLPIVILAVVAACLLASCLTALALCRSATNLNRTPTWTPTEPAPAGGLPHERDAATAGQRARPYPMPRLLEAVRRDPEMPTTEIEGTEEGNGHVSSSGHYHRGLGRHAIKISWHTACLDTFRAGEVRLREQVRQDNREMIRSVAETGGLEVDEALAEFDRRNPPAPARP